MTEPERTSREVYSALRRKGTVWLRWDEAGLLTTIRRLAKADGLQVTQYREPLPTATSAQRRTRPITVQITRDGHHIVTPDADQQETP